MPAPPHSVILTPTVFLMHKTKQCILLHGCYKGRTKPTKELKETRQKKKIRRKKSSSNDLVLEIVWYFIVQVTKFVLFSDCSSSAVVWCVDLSALFALLGWWHCGVSRQSWTATSGILNMRSWALVCLHHRCFGIFCYMQTIINPTETIGVHF